MNISQFMKLIPIHVKSLKSSNDGRLQSLENFANEQTLWTYSVLHYIISTSATMPSDVESCSYCYKNRFVGVRCEMSNTRDNGE
ncbi:hypothetical protein AVEN_82382-1 [Araneus ventricosus]|uniref:Uncharacterized protein n=1 Tax=Araneus ventricosus TaxID=182803 RepID=A0A4Y2HIR4_ARAVE|nr:hypothetical protein AVEN_82382-1 [Araneus ventricosus]